MWFKNLKIYMFFVALPFVMLLVGASIFSDGIMMTITRNPHPQINYTIFTIILGGGILVLLNAKRLRWEAKVSTAPPLDRESRERTSFESSGKPSQSHPIPSPIRPPKGSVSS